MCVEYKPLFLLLLLTPSSIFIIHPKMLASAAADTSPDLDLVFSISFFFFFNLKKPPPYFFEDSYYKYFKRVERSSRSGGVKLFLRRRPRPEGNYKSQKGAFISGSRCVLCRKLAANKKAVGCRVIVLHISQQKNPFVITTFRSCEAAAAATKV